MKRILLLIATNLAVMLVLSVVVSVLGLDRWLSAEGIDWLLTLRAPAPQLPALLDSALRRLGDPPASLRAQAERLAQREAERRAGELPIRQLLQALPGWLCGRGHQSCHEFTCGGQGGPALLSQRADQRGMRLRPKVAILRCPAGGGLKRRDVWVSQHV